MAIRLVVMDLDGCINDNWQLFGALETKMYELMELHSVQFALCTGRRPMEAYYFMHQAKFPFRWAGCGGGIIIDKPMEKEKIKDLFDDFAIQTIRGGGFHKVGRLLVIKERAGVTDDEMLYIEDNANRNADIADVKKRVKCRIGTPATSNSDWLKHVKESGGYISLFPVGEGTLDILEHYFG